MENLDNDLQYKATQIEQLQEIDGKYNQRFIAVQ